MPTQDELQFGPIGEECVHLCVDMQRLFAENTLWKTPRLAHILPQIKAITEAHPSRTIFTRFIPLEKPEDGHGTWRRYYQRWEDMTLSKLDISLINLMPELQGFTPPAEIVDKYMYAPWIGTDLHPRLQKRHITTLIITGSETDICILATILGAIDLGYRVVLVTDAVCSSSDTAYDAQMDIYRRRFSMQVETVPTAEILKHWR